MCEEVYLKARMDRRRFIKLATAATAMTFGQTMFVPLRSSLAFGAIGNNKKVVFVFLGGGCSGAILPGTSSAEQAWYGSIYPANPLIVGTGEQAFHPSLPKLFARYQAGKVAVVNGIGGADNTRSHEEETDGVLTALSRNMRATAAEAGLGARVAAMTPSNPLAALSLSGQDAWSQGNINPPLDIDNISNGGERSYRWSTNLHNMLFRPTREAVAAQAETRNSEDLSLVRNGIATVQSTFASIQAYNSTVTGVTFPGTGIGNQLQDIAKIIIAQKNSAVQTAMFLSSDGGYDTHSNQAAGLAGNLTRVDNAVDAFLQAMELNGLANDVTVVTMTEFGRTNINGNGGTDHGNLWKGLVMGGRIQGGIKTAPATSGELTGQYERYANARIDSRAYLSQIVEVGLGLPIGSVIPEFNSIPSNLKPNLNLFI